MSELAKLLMVAGKSTVRGSTSAYRSAEALALVRERYLMPKHFHYHCRVLLCVFNHSSSGHFDLLYAVVVCTELKQAF